jgi:hypothetical protein
MQGLGYIPPSLASWVLSLTKQGTINTEKMGRNKIDASKLIDNKRDRDVRYRKRKAGFEHKGAELSTMTGTDVVIVCVPRHNNGQASVFTSGPTVTEQNWKTVVEEFTRLDSKAEHRAPPPKRSKSEPQPIEVVIRQTEPTQAQMMISLPQVGLTSSLDLELPSLLLVEVSPRLLNIWPLAKQQ